MNKDDDKKDDIDELEKLLESFGIAKNISLRDVLDNIEEKLDSIDDIDDLDDLDDIQSSNNGKKSHISTNISTIGSKRSSRRDSDKKYNCENCGREFSKSTRYRRHSRRCSEQNEKEVIDLSSEDTEDIEDMSDWINMDEIIQKPVEIPEEDFTIQSVRINGQYLLVELQSETIKEELPDKDFVSMDNLEYKEGYKSILVSFDKDN
jgi:hypothetical protein